MKAKVKLEGTNTNGLYVLADNDGAFRFQNIGPGSYTLVVEAGEEYETVRESVFIEGNSLGRGLRISSPARNIQVPIYLQPKRSSRGAARSGVLNAALATMPKPATELYTKALESAHAGDSKKAVEQLEGAISLYPDFAVALNELGVQYLKLGNPGKAAQALRSALRIDPDALIPRLNYGIALLQKREFAAAETQLREVLKKSRDTATAHLYLGITLIHLRNYDESENELLQALAIGGNELAPAHYYLGGLFWRKKDYPRATQELETYLKLAPKAPDAERTRSAIRELRSK